METYSILGYAVWAWPAELRGLRQNCFARRSMWTRTRRGGCGEAEIRLYRRHQKHGRQMCCLGFMSSTVFKTSYLLVYYNLPIKSPPPPDFGKHSNSRPQLRVFLVASDVVSLWTHLWTKIISDKVSPSIFRGNLCQQRIQNCCAAIFVCLEEPPHSMPYRELRNAHEWYAVIGSR